jgi:3-oxoacyl-[acyl-carrier-protein] synthase-3
MNSKVIGTGSYLPKKIMTNHDLAQIIDTSDEWIKERSGIMQRHIIADNEATSDLASNAAISALKMANLEPSEIDLIIVATFTGDKPLPSTATMVQKKINAVNAAAFDVSAACTGFIYGLTIADQFIKTGFYKNILVIGAETLTRFTNWEDRSTCILFGDGAGAAVLTSDDDPNTGILQSCLHSDGFKPSEWLDIPAGGSLKPTNQETLFSNEHSMRMNGKEIYKFASKVIVESINEVLKKSNLSITDIDYIIPHQANLRIVESASKRFDIPIEKFIMNIDKCANTSAASIPIALDQAIRSGKIKRNDKLILVAFGGGLTWGSILLHI